MSNQGEGSIRDRDNRPLPRGVQATLSNGLPSASGQGRIAQRLGNISRKAIWIWVLDARPRNPCRITEAASSRTV